MFTYFKVHLCVDCTYLRDNSLAESVQYTVCMVKRGSLSTLGDCGQTAAHLQSLGLITLESVQQGNNRGTFVFFIFHKYNGVRRFHNKLINN